jgi:hypothetical protein
VRRFADRACAVGIGVVAAKPLLACQDISLPALILFAKNPSIKPFLPGNAPGSARGGFFGLNPVILSDV